MMIQMAKLEQLKIEAWKGEPTKVQDLALYSSLFYEETTGYIYCPKSKDDGSIMMADIVAFVDDHGFINPVLPGSEYRLQKEWEGFTILHPIVFCCKLWYRFYQINREIYASQKLGEMEDQLRDLITITDNQNEIIQSQKQKIHALEVDRELQSDSI